MNYYHICTEGVKDNVLFKCSEDYVCAMNYVAITCIEQDIRLLAFCIMSNHFHFVVRTEFSKAKKFIISVKRRYSLNHWHKYGGHKLLAGRKHPIRIKEIQDTDYLKSAIAYVLRNPLSSFGELFWVYPWSSLGAYFNGMFTRNPGIILNDKSNEYVINLMNAIQERIVEVNKVQMEELGVSENENPMQYLIPTLFATNQATAEIDEQAVNAFNAKFELYQSTNTKGATVKGLLTTIQNNNETEGNNKIEEINMDGEEYEVTEQNITLLKSSINVDDAYRVEFEKDINTGLIYRAVINKR